jgi:hypothetical protein
MTVQILAGNVARATATFTPDEGEVTDVVCQYISPRGVVTAVDATNIDTNVFEADAVLVDDELDGTARFRFKSEEPLITVEEEFDVVRSEFP